MSTAGGPKLAGIGRSGNNLPLYLDCTVGASYAGDPTTNASYDSSIGGYTTLSQTYDWNNSGTSSRTNNPAGILKPPGYAATTVAVCEKKCLTTGSQHMGMGYCDSGISGSTVYTVSLWYRQNGTGVGGPYVRQKVNNNNLGGMEWVGRDGTQAITGTSNWPANEWILLKKTVTTSSDETGLYISNYIGSAVGDTIWCFGPQIEAKSYFTPLVLDASGNAAASSRSATDAWRDLSQYVNDGDLINGADTGVSYYKDGYITNNVSRTHKSNSFNYIDFDGTDDYVSIPHSSAIMLARTWSLWFNLDRVPDSSTYDSIFQKDDNWNDHGGTMLSMIYGNLRFGWGTYWAADCSISLSGNITTGKWYHFTGTSTGDTTSGGVKMYLDGALKDTGTANGVPTDTSILKIGSGNGGPIDGRISNFTLYSIELSAAQVKANFNQQRSRFGV
jgi:hypothetical protein